MVAPVSSFVYTVTINGIRGNGSLELDLIDNDSIRDAGNNPLGGVGVANGSFQGQSYSILQAGPQVVSINRTLPTGTTADAVLGVNYTVTFNEPVTGVDASDFSVVTGGAVSVSAPIVVSGSGAVYVVDINGISGGGTLGLNLVDDGSIRDSAGNPLQAGSASFQSQATLSTNPSPSALAVSDLNGDGISDLAVSAAPHAGFTFSTLDDPLGVKGTVPLGVSGNNIVGVYFDAANKPHGFIYNGSGFTTLDNPLGVNGTRVTGIYGTTVVGYYFDAANNTRGFTYNGTSYTPLDDPLGPTSTQPQAVYGTTIVGVYGSGHGFKYDGTTFTTLDNPSGTYTAAYGISGGLIAGVYADGSDHGFVYDGSVWTPLNAPLAANLTRAYGIDGSNVVGTYRDGTNIYHGFVFNGTTYTMLDDPLASGGVTFANAISGNTVIGDYVTSDNLPHGFITTIPEPTGGVVGVLLGNGNGSFQSQHTFSSGTNPYSIAASDLDGDGIPDLIAANGGSSNLSVLLGNGNGTFQAQRSFLTGANLRSAVVSDVNGDGKPDLIVASFSENTVGVLLGNGNGTFQSLQTFAVGSGPNTVSVSDVNGDGKPDLAIVNYYNNTVGVLLGTGNGSFLAQKTFAVGLKPRSLVASDVNCDGKPDLLVANFSPSGTVSLLLGNGDGTFRAQPDLTIGPRPNFVTVSDLNGDGWSDVVVANAVNNTVGVLLGNGNGTFKAQQTFATGTGPSSIAVTDVNRDGRPDLMMTNSKDNTVGMLLGSGNGNFTGQVYTIIATADVIAGTPNSDSITLRQDPDLVHIDWTLGGTSGQLPINDPNGLTINGNGSIDAVTLDYSNGNPLPNTLHLNGVFTLNGLQGANPLANTSLEIGRGTDYISYAGPASDPVGAVRSYLVNGYHGGAWNGTPTASTGVITSLAAAQNAPLTGIGYADSADGSGVNPIPNTVEVKYTLAADANLDGQVSLADFSILTSYFGNPQVSWDRADFNYDGQVSLADFSTLTTTFGTPLPAAAPAVGTAVGGQAPAGVAWAAAPVATAAPALPAGDDATDSGLSLLGKRRKHRDRRLPR